MLAALRFAVSVASSSPSRVTRATWTLLRPCARLSRHAHCVLQVTMEDYPEAGMSALKYYTIQSYTK